MSKSHIIRAWKDQEYRNSLSDAQRAAPPENPAGAIELTLDELKSVDGGAGEHITGTPCWIDDLSIDPPPRTAFCPDSSAGGGLTSVFRAR